MDSSRYSAFTFLLATIFMLVGAAPATAADFLISTEIFVGEQAEKPAASNSTYFRGNIVYDFAAESGEITIFNAESGRFILLDKQRRVRTELTTRELLAYAQWIRSQSKNSDDKLLTFCANPVFEVKAGEAEDSWEFRSKFLTYRVTHDTSADDGIAAQYRNFCDWFARLNSVTNPGSLPPFARMEINAHLEQSDAIPKSVMLNVAPHARFGNRELLVRSEHAFRPGLTASDVAEIEKAERFLVTFTEVSLENYREAVVAAGGTEE